MNNKETRKEKLKILQAIKEGKISPDSLQPPKVYIFTERSNKPGVYEHEGKEYNETEYREFCEMIKQRSKKSVIFHERQQCLKEDTIITMCYSGKKKSEPGEKSISLNLGSEFK